MSKLSKILKQNRLRIEKIRKEKEPHKYLPINQFILGKYEMPSLKIVAEDDPEKDPHYILGHRPW